MRIIRPQHSVANGVSEPPRGPFLREAETQLKDELRDIDRRETAMTYDMPQDVHTPTDCLALGEILGDQGSDQWSLAAGKWRGHPCLLIRLNGNSNRPSGYPVAFGRPAWLVVPTELNQHLMPLLSPAQQSRMAAFLPSGANVICWPAASASTNGPKYLPPREVTPRSGRCRLGKVLIDQGPSLSGPAKFAIALGSWAGRQQILLRWNGIPGTRHAKGMPLAGSHANWFPLPIAASVFVSAEDK